QERPRQRRNVAACVERACEGARRHLEISALDRTAQRSAAHRDRQGAALQAARGGGAAVGEVKRISATPRGEHRWQVYAASVNLAACEPRKATAPSGAGSRKKLYHNGRRTSGTCVSPIRIMSA